MKKSISQNDFEKKIIELQKEMYLTAYSIVRHRYDAEDVVQNSVYLAFCKIKQLRNPEKFKQWIIKIVVNESYKMLKKRKNDMEHSVAENKMYFCAIDTDIEFFDIISKLNRNDKIIIILRFYNGFSLQQISKILKIPISTVKSRLYRAIEKIKLEVENN